MALRREEVQRAADDIVEAAEAAGWIVTRREVFSKGCSIYINAHLTTAVAVTIRVSNHAPSRPLGLSHDRPTLVALVGLPGGVAHPIRWLQRAAEEVRVVQAGNTCKARLRGTV